MIEHQPCQEKKDSGSVLSLLKVPSSLVILAALLSEARGAESPGLPKVDAPLDNSPVASQVLETQSPVTPNLPPIPELAPPPVNPVNQIEASPLAANDAKAPVSQDAEREDALDVEAREFDEDEPKQSFMQSVKEWFRENKDSTLDWIAKGSLGALTAIGALSAYRGVSKLYKEKRDKYVAKRRFERGEYVDVISCNIHTFREEDGLLKLQVFPVATPRISEFLPNERAEELFSKAVSDCTAEQPFPSLNYKRERDTSRLSGLNRINKFMRESFSSLFRDGVAAHATGLPVASQSFVLIPLCEVSSGESQGRVLSLAAISERDFQRFGNEADVARMVGDDLRIHKRIHNFQSAYRESHVYRRLHRLNGKGEELFPTVPIFAQQFRERWARAA